MGTPSPQHHKFEALDGMRGVFALFVALAHFHVMGHFFEFPLIRVGLGVDFFFVLSGFVITHASLKQLNSGKDLGIFTLRRFGRVWPLHAAMLAILIPFELLKLIMAHAAGLSGKYAPFAPDSPSSISSIFTNLLMIQSLGIHNTTTWNGPSWSISVEFYTYILFALLAIFCRKWLTPLMAFIGTAAGLILMYKLPNIHVQYDYAFLRCVYGFFTGYFVYQAFKLSRRPLAYPALTEILSILLIGAFITAAAFTKLSLLAPLAFALPVFVLAYQQGPVSRLLCTRPFQILGKLSYSLYITHYVFILVFERGMATIEKITHKTLHVSYPAGRWSATPLDVYTIGNPWLMDLMAIAFVILALAFAALATRFIEDPARIYFNTLAKKWQNHGKPAPHSAKA